MFIVITGLDGSGTSTIAKKLHELDKGSVLLKTPSIEYSDREKIDTIVRKDSITAHFLYYLSSTVYMSDYIKKNLDYKNKNVYCVRYLIDTVVSNRVAGIDVNLNYNIYGNQLLKPDITLFVTVDEVVRQERITARGKSVLDKVLDDVQKREAFLSEFQQNLPSDSTIIVNNNYSDVNKCVMETYKKINSINKTLKDNKQKKLVKVK